MTRYRSIAALILAVGAASAVPAVAQTADAALIQKARAIHDRVIALDTHNDIDPGNFTRQKNYTQRLDTQVNVTLELVRRGYTDEQIGKLWSGNLLRVMAEVEKVAKQIQAAQK